MKASFKVLNTTFSLAQVSCEDMDEMLKSETRSFPAYFDKKKRVWPLPQVDVLIEFEEELDK